MTRVACLLLLLPLTACGGEDLEGFLWDVTLTGEEDLCNAEPIGYQETLTYRLAFDGQAAEVAVDENVFATGLISGCEITYDSVVWGEQREASDGQLYDLRWQIEGQAFFHQGFGCETQLADNLDWEGTETFTIVQSDHPEIPPNCTYTLAVEGTYIGPVGE